MTPTAIRHDSLSGDDSYRGAETARSGGPTYAHAARYPRPDFGLLSIQRRLRV